MKKTFKRTIAYFIDIIVILLITQSLSGIPQINKQLDKYNKHYNEYIELYQNYTSFKVDLADEYEEKQLDNEDYLELIEEYPEYKEVLNKYYIDNKLTEKNYKKLNKEIDENYQKDYKKIYYQIEKNSILYFIIYLISTFLYFVGFNLYTNGQTLGKKLLRLKIVNAKDETKPVSALSYIIRTIILYQPIYYLAKLIGVFLLDMNSYFTLTTIFTEINYYTQLLVIAFVTIRLDGKGPHDLLAKTRVVLYDKNGNEVVDKLEEIVKETKKNTKKKKIIDEPIL